MNWNQSTVLLEYLAKSMRHASLTSSTYPGSCKSCFFHIPVFGGKVFLIFPIIYLIVDLKLMCIWNHREFPGILPMGLPFAIEIIMFNVYMCICVHMCGGHPQTPPHIIHPSHPQIHREPKTLKFNKSWTNQDISILFEDSLPLNIPELI